jgi:hypothetical protein
MTGNRNCRVKAFAHDSVTDGPVVRPYLSMGATAGRAA